MNRKKLEDRLIDFAVVTAEIIKEMPNNKIVNHLANQLVRSCTALALSYGEMQSAVSHKDFVHKMSIVLRELRVSLIYLIIIKRSRSCSSVAAINKAVKECNELVSILYRSVQTAAKKNQ